MPTTLVTGGAGFIGSHLVEALLAAGDRVVVLDDVSTGSFANLAAVRGHDRLTCIQGSVCDEVAVDEAIQGCDRVVHLAAAVGVKRILERRVGSLVANVRGTEVVLRAALAHGRLPVFVASTSEVYGKNDKVPFREDGDHVLGPTSLHRWSYACSKLIDEFLAFAYAAERGLPVVCGRFFNVTGPRQSPAYGMVLPRFCTAAAAGRALEVHGDGTQSRCFLHVLDAVDAVMLLLGCPQANGLAVNIGSDAEVPILDLAKRVVARAGSASQVRMISYAEAWPQGGFEDMRRRLPDTTRLRSLVPWSPRRTLDDIIDGCLSDARR
jgi:UDP-glucose 4-epimerase